MPGGGGRGVKTWTQHDKRCDGLWRGELCRKQTIRRRITIPLKIMDATSSIFWKAKPESQGNYQAFAGMKLSCIPKCQTP